MHVQIQAIFPSRHRQGGVTPRGTNLHHVLVDLLRVSVDKIDLLGVAVLHDLLLVGVVLVLVRHI